MQTHDQKTSGAIQVHERVVERTALETEIKYDSDGNAVGEYTVRCRWHEIVQEPRRIQGTYQPVALQRARARYAPQPLHDVPDHVFVLRAGVIRLRGPNDLRALAKLPDFSAAVAWGNTVSVRAAKRTAKRAASERATKAYGLQVPE